MEGELDARQVDRVALALEIEQRHEAAQEHLALGDMRDAVVNDLAEERVEAQIRQRVRAKEGERVHRLAVVLSLGRIELPDDPFRHGLDGRR